MKRPSRGGRGRCRYGAARIDGQARGSNATRRSSTSVASSRPVPTSGSSSSVSSGLQPSARRRASSREGLHRHLTDGLLENRIDVATLEMSSHLHAELRCFQLRVGTLRLISPRQPGHEAAKAPVSLDDVASLPIIAPGRAHAIRRIVDASFERNRLKFDPVIEANGALMIFELVKARYGHSIMPESSCFPSILSGALRAVPIRPGIRRTISLIAQAGSINERMVASCTALVQGDRARDRRQPPVRSGSAVSRGGRAAARRDPAGPAGRKQVIGDALRSRTDERRAAKVELAVHALSRMLERGRPTCVRIA